MPDVSHVAGVTCNAVVSDSVTAMPYSYFCANSDCSSGLRNDGTHTKLTSREEGRHSPFSSVITRTYERRSTYSSAAKRDKDSVIRTLDLQE